MTREELVQMREYKVAQASTEYWSKNKDNDEVSIMTAFEDGIDWADEHPKSPWISVENRLPEEDKDVFVRKICTNGIFHLVGKVLNGGKWYCYGFGWQDADAITHWMPIPEN